MSEALICTAASRSYIVPSDCGSRDLGNQASGRQGIILEAAGEPTRSCFLACPYSLCSPSGQPGASKATTAPSPCGSPGAARCPPDRCSSTSPRARRHPHRPRRSACRPAPAPPDRQTACSAGLLSSAPALPAGLPVADPHVTCSRYVTQHPMRQCSYVQPTAGRSHVPSSAVHCQSLCSDACR